MPARGRPVLRRCVACRQLKDRIDLWRLVRLAGGGLALDAGMGRSAYLCPDPACLEDARRRRRFQRSLRCAVEETIFHTLEGRLPSQAAPTEAR